MFYGDSLLASLIFVAASSIVLSSVVIYHDVRNVSIRLFGLMSLSFAVWSIINYFSIDKPPEQTLFWVRLVLASAAPQAFLFALFTRNFPDKKLIMSKKAFYIFLILIFCQILLALSPYVFESIATHNNNLVPNVGPGMIFYAFVLIFFFSYGIYWLIKKLRANEKETKNGVRIIFISFLVVVILVLFFLFFAVVFFKNTTFIPYSHLFILPFILGSSYALTRQKFLDIKLIATEFLVGVLLIFLFTEAFMAGSLEATIWKLFFAFFVGFMGYLLIRSVLKEVKQREQLEQLTTKLQDANIHLQELDRLKTEFISVASHQLRTPLTATRWALEFLANGEDGKLNDKQAETVDELVVTNRKLINLVNDLLNISRIDENRLKIDPKPLNLAEVIEEMMKEFMPIARQKKLKVVQNYEPMKPISLDENVIAKAISNFLSNGIKYNRDGKQLTITLKKVGTEAVLSIQDEGIGIPKDEQKNLFQKFYRASNAATSQTEGSGLGLYIAKAAIERSGGRIWFESTEGVGSIFYIAIPLAGSKAVEGEKSLS